ncbi:MAG: glutamate dehydrogenase, partial [Lutibacter sp.]|nr:glutamate dehydrogenase [Lutibacter sp.]
MNVKDILNNLETKHPGEQEYLQAVHEVLDSIESIYNENPQYEAAKIIERLVEPDRILTFRVSWVDDEG